MNMEKKAVINTNINDTEVDDIRRKVSLKDNFYFNRLAEHKAQLDTQHMRQLFAADPKRFSNFSMQQSGILFDYSKNIISKEVMADLFSLARDSGLVEQINDTFSGEEVNTTEHRSVLHTALRNRGPSSIYVHGEDVMPKVLAELKHMRHFTELVRSGKWQGATGKSITDIVNIGIGGSDLGPDMAVKALKPYTKDGLNCHFISNVDASQVIETLQLLNYETTLFVIVSKTFTTQETLINAKAAKAWFQEKISQPEAIAKHFVAVSTNQKEVASFGIKTSNIFEFWDWVGGRYSLWSSVGLTVALSVGMDHFEEMLEGAYEMDEHFINAPLEKNMPVILALLGIWYRNFFDVNSHMIAPYDQHLHRFPAYLQQLEMESNGKNIDKQGQPVDVETCPVIWGEPGTNSQHAFFQLIHQGTDLIPTDFILVKKCHHSSLDQHRLLLSNGLSQSESLMRGKDLEEVREELVKSEMSHKEIEKLAPFKVFNGNRPSNTLLLDILDPKTFGALLALYEHKVLVQGIIWNINSYDQWGVELGKQLAKTISSELDAGLKVSSHDSSTNGLMNYLIK